MKKFCVIVKNSVGAVLKLGFSNVFFIKVVSLVKEDDIIKLKKEFKDIPIVGRGCVSNEFSNLDMNTLEGAKLLKERFDAKYGWIETTIEECQL